MSAISTWSTTAANNNLAPPDGWPEGQAPSTVNDVGREMIAALRTQFEDAQWFNDGKTKTRVSTTQFRIDGEDVTSAYHVGRRVKFVGTLTGTIYGIISVTAFSTDTTVTIVWDSGSLSNETLTGSYGILTSADPSLGRIDGSLHIRPGSAGVTASTSADDFVVEFSGAGGASFLGGDGTAINLQFGSPGDASGVLQRWTFDNKLFQIGTATASGEMALMSGSFGEAVRINSSQNVIVASPTSVTLGTDAALLQVNDTAATPKMAVSRWSNDNGAAILNIGKSRGGSVGTNVIVGNTDFIGTIGFYGDDGTDLVTAVAAIGVQMDGGTPAANDLQGKMTLQVNIGGGSPSTALTLDSNLDIYEKPVKIKIYLGAVRRTLRRTIP